MESTGIVGRIQCSRATYEMTHDVFDFEERTDVYVKGKGNLTTYLVAGKKKNIAINTVVAPAATTFTSTQQ